jgi:hypothetical protein
MFRTWLTEAIDKTDSIAYTNGSLSTYPKDSCSTDVSNEVYIKTNAEETKA